jgi:fused signal recognition particle receptor
MEPNPLWISPDLFDWLIEHARLLAVSLLLVPGLLALLLEGLTRKAKPSAEAEPALGAGEREYLDSAERLGSAPERTPAPGLAPRSDTAVGEPPAPIPERQRESEPPSESEPAPVVEPAWPRVESDSVPTTSGASSLRARLARTSETLVGRLGGILSGRKVDAALIEELEMALFTADMGVATAESLLDRVKKEATGSDADRVRKILKDSILEKLLRVEESRTEPVSGSGPHVILVLGVNGSGKTTTVGKLAARFSAQGKAVILGAGDTFRAAAIDQLQVWGERVGCQVVAGKPGGDPAAVAFDTVKTAIATKADVVIIDTAGRLQTKKPLMEELAKIARVLSRDLPEAPHETLLVLDSNTGQNAISQTRLFTEVTQLTGLVLTKLDGSAKGGVIVGLADEFGIPVHFVGVGEGIEDLLDFRAEEFVDALFGED